MRLAPDVHAQLAALARRRGEDPERMANEALRAWLGREH